MIPVYQTRTVANDGSGNCFAACVASILELPLRDVCQALPNGPKHFWSEWESWAEAHGLELALHVDTDNPPKGYSIASGYGGRRYPEGHSLAGREILHAAVVFNGRLVHDPFPGAETFDRIDRYWTIDPVQAGARAEQAA